LADLAKILVLPEIKKIIKIQSIPISIRNRIYEIISPKQEKFENHEKALGVCGYCDWRKNRKIKAVEYVEHIYAKSIQDK